MMDRVCFLVLVFLETVVNHRGLANLIIVNENCTYWGGSDRICSIITTDCNGSAEEYTGPGEAVYPMLTRVEVEPRQNDSQSPETGILALQWTIGLPDLGGYVASDDLEGWQAVMVMVGGQPLATACLIAEFNYSTDSQTPRPQFSFGVELENVTALPPNWSLTAAVTSLTTYASQEYVIAYARDIRNVLDPPTVDQWETVVALGANKYQRRIYAIFQPAPGGVNFTEYKLKIHSADGESYPHRIARGEPTYWFPILTEVDPNGTDYTLEITIVDEVNCSLGCLVASRSVLLPDYQPVTPTPYVIASSSKPRQTTKNPDSSTGLSTSVKIGVGVTMGIICVTIMAVLILYFVCKRRNKNVQNNFVMQKLEGDSSASGIPSVLILYSPDCAAHEQVVIELANFMREEWHLEVYLDLWDQKSILDRGWMQWMNEKLMEAQFALVICSIGARYKCARNRQFRMKYDRAVPDMFVNAVDLVLERSHAAKQPNTGINSPECLVAYFSYAGESEIPPKLDKAKRFVLMNDICDLYCHVSRTSADKLNPADSCFSAQNYKYTKSGKQLHSVLVKAVDFFVKNPDWLGELLEPIGVTDSSPSKKASVEKGEEDTTDGPTDGPTEQRKPASPGKDEVGNNSHRSGVDSSSHSRMSSSATEEDALLEERVKRRMQEREAKMEKVPSAVNTHKFGQSQTSYAPQVDNNSSKVNGSFIPAPPKANSAVGRRMSPLHSPSVCEDIDEEQMRKDLDFIHNFDLHHAWYKTADPSELLVNMDFSSCTPPEDVPLSQTYKNFSVYNGPSLANGVNDFVNPLFFTAESSRGSGVPDLVKALPRVKSDKNDNVVIEFEVPGAQRNRLQSDTNACDSSTKL